MACSYYMKDILRILGIIMIAFVIPGAIVLAGQHLSYAQFALIWIGISTAGIVLFILYFPGKRHHPDKDKREL